MGWAVNLVGATNFPVQSPIMAVAAPPISAGGARRAGAGSPRASAALTDRALTARPCPAILCSSFLSVSVPQALHWSGLTASPGVPVLLTHPSPGCSGAMAGGWSPCLELLHPSRMERAKKREFPEALQVVCVP